MSACSRLGKSSPASHHLGTGGAAWALASRAGLELAVEKSQRSSSWPRVAIVRLEIHDSLLVHARFAGLGVPAHASTRDGWKVGATRAGYGVWDPAQTPQHLLDYKRRMVFEDEKVVMAVPEDPS